MDTAPTPTPQDPYADLCEGLGPRLPPPPTLHRAFGLGRSGKHEEAAAMFQDVYQSSSTKDTRSLAYRGYGTAMQKLGRLAEAEAAFKSSVDLHPHSVTGWRQLGAVQAQRGALEQAEQSLRRGLSAVERLTERNARKAVDHFPRMQRKLGHVLGRQGKHAEAEETLRDCVWYDNPDPTVLRSLAASLRAQGKEAQAQSNSGLALQLEGHLEASEALLRGALDDWPDDGSVRHALATCLIKAGKYEEAVGFARDAVRLKPEFHGYQAILGYALVRAQQYAEALPTLRAYFASPAYRTRGGEDAYARLHEGEACLGLGDGPGAEAAYSHVLARSRSTGGLLDGFKGLKEALALQGKEMPPDVRLRHGATLAKANKGRAARQELEAALAAGADGALAKAWLGHVFLHQGKTDEALQVLQEAAALGGNNITWLNLGKALIRAGRFKEAEEAFRRFDPAASTDVTRGESACYLGIALALQGRLYTARSLFIRARGLDPTNPLALDGHAAAQAAMTLHAEPPDHTCHDHLHFIRGRVHTHP